MVKKVLLCLMPALLMCSGVVLANDPQLQDNDATDWVDLGHWMWNYPHGLSCSLGGCKQGEVYYSPGSEVTEPAPAPGVVIRDVMVKVVWGYDPENGAPHHLDVGGDNDPNDFTLQIDGNQLWQVAIVCNAGTANSAENTYGLSPWWRDEQNQLHHGRNAGPYTIQYDSVEYYLKPILCR